MSLSVSGERELVGYYVMQEVVFSDSDDEESGKKEGKPEPGVTKPASKVSTLCGE